MFSMPQIAMVVSDASRRTSKRAGEKQQWLALLPGLAVIALLALLAGNYGYLVRTRTQAFVLLVPLIAYGPGIIQRGKSVTDMVANLDIAPTILDLAGAETD